MTVIPFPRLQDEREKRLRGIESCLKYLQAEAEGLRLPVLAHLIAVARMEASDTGKRAG